MPLRLRIKFYALKYGLHAFILLMVMGFAFLLDKHIEAVFLLVLYGFIRYKFPKTFHHHNTYWCVFWSIVSMWLCIVASLPLQYSILSTVIVAIILCFILYKIQDYVDVRAELAEVTVPMSKPFDVSTCTREEMIARCRKVGLSKDSTDIAIAYFVEKSMSLWDIAEKYNIEYDSAKLRVIRIKKKLIS